MALWQMQSISNIVIDDCYLALQHENNYEHRIQYPLFLIILNRIQNICLKLLSWAGANDGIKKSVALKIFKAHKIFLTLSLLLWNAYCHLSYIFIKI